MANGRGGPGQRFQQSYWLDRAWLASSCATITIASPPWAFKTNFHSQLYSRRQGHNGVLTKICLDPLSYCSLLTPSAAFDIITCELVPMMSQMPIILIF